MKTRTDTLKITYKIPDYESSRTRLISGFALDAPRELDKLLRDYPTAQIIGYGYTSLWREASEWTSVPAA